MMKSIKSVLGILFVVVILSACAGKGNSNSSNDSKSVSKTKSVEEMATFYEAALEGDINLVKQFINEGVDVNSIDEQKRTALMLASFNGHLAIVQFLIAKGANINMVDELNRNALMFASTGPFNDTVLELIKAGAEVNAQDSHEQWTALMFAAGEGQLEVVKTLIENGADPKLLDDDGDTALNFARNNNHQKVVEYLEALQ